MKIEIEIDADHADLISDWASVRRTLTEAMQTTSNEACADELEAIIPAMEALQHALRTAVWKVQPDRKASRMKHRLVRW